VRTWAAKLSSYDRTALTAAREASQGRINSRTLPTDQRIGAHIFVSLSCLLSSCHIAATGCEVGAWVNTAAVMEALSAIQIMVDVYLSITDGRILVFLTHNRSGSTCSC